MSSVATELPTKKGDYFEGHIIWDTCTLRKPDVIGFEVTEVKPCDTFTAVAQVSFRTALLLLVIVVVIVLVVVLVVAVIVVVVVGRPHNMSALTAPTYFSSYDTITF